MLKYATTCIATAALVGCTTVQPGPAQDAAAARLAKPLADKSAIYFCRQWAYAGGGISLYPRIDGKAVATLETKTFTRIDLQPGEYEIALAYADESDSSLFKAVQRAPVKMETLNAKVGEVYYYWIGMAGSSLFGGSLTIDHFDNKAQALDCIQESIYVSPRSSIRSNL